MTVALTKPLGLSSFLRAPALPANPMLETVGHLPPVAESHLLLNALDSALLRIQPDTAKLLQPNSIKRDRFFREGGIHVETSFAGKEVFRDSALPTGNAFFKAVHKRKEDLFANLGWEEEKGERDKTFSAAIFGYSHFEYFLSKLLGGGFVSTRWHPQKAITESFRGDAFSNTNGLQGAVTMLGGGWRTLDKRFYHKIHRDENGVTLYYQFPNGEKFDPSKKTVLLATEYHVGENIVPNQGGGIGVVPYLYQDRASYGLIASAANAAALFGGLKVFQEVHGVRSGDPMPFNVALLINILAPGAKVNWSTVLPKVPALKPDLVIAAADQFIGLPYSDDPKDTFVYYLYNRQWLERGIERRIEAMTGGQPARPFIGHNPEQSIFGALSAFYDQAKVFGVNVVDDKAKPGTAAESVHIPTILRVMAMVAGSLELVTLP